MPTLAELKPGQSCIVKKLTLSGASLQRVLTMGFLPGVEIQILHNAPLLDPLDVQVNKTMVALRKAEAGQIEVEVK